MFRRIPWWLDRPTRFVLFAQGVLRGIVSGERGHIGHLFAIKPDDVWKILANRPGKGKKK